MNTARGFFIATIAGTALAGCVRTSFTQTDFGFALHPAAQRPNVFLDRLPERPYRSVGIIEVISPAGFTLNQILGEVIEQGQNVGCDVIVDRSIYRVSQVDEALPRFVFAQYIPPPTPAPAPVYSPPPDRHEFICGVYDAGAPPSSAPSKL